MSRPHQLAILLTDLAKMDLALIQACLLPGSPVGLARVSRELETAILGLAEFPQMGRLREELGANVRSVVVREHMVFYRLAPGNIVILRVLDTRMDIDAEWQS